ncbi:MAG TPA: hypothetical protein VFK02_30815 [Kofleriaceae bacterium]|nr:hypothetical protein [Kofleriaceae bacterium]
MRRLMLACSLLFCACTDDAGTITNAAFGETCTVVSNTSTECASGVCTDSFDMVGHPVCSQQCTAGMNDTCPMGASGAKMCNMKGYCKP